MGPEGGRREGGMGMGWRGRAGPSDGVRGVPEGEKEVIEEQGERGVVLGGQLLWSKGNIVMERRG